MVTPILLLEKLYRARPVEEADRFAGVLEEVLRQKRDAGDQAGFDRLVDSLSEEYNGEIEVKKRRSFWTFITDLVSRVITAVITPFAPKL